MMGNDIGIWMFGVTGVGKTRMISAMARGFEQISLDSKVPNAYSFYHASSDDLKSNPVLTPVSTDWEQTSPTKQMGQAKYVLQVHRHGHIKDKYGITILDTPGNKAEERDYRKSDEGFFIKVLENTKGVLIVLEPESKFFSRALDLVDYAAQAYEQNAKSSKMTWNPKKYKVALCLNKMDKMNLRWHDPDRAMEIMFGHEWISLKQKNANQYHNISIQPYLTSSVGFVSGRRGIEYPNQIFSKEQQTEKLLYPDEWMPWNITQPLLWILMDKPDKESQQDLIPCW